MFKVIHVVYLLSSIVLGIELPPEPQLPTSVCAEVQALFTEGPVGYLPENAESSPDTERIQAALNKCGPGNALKLVKGVGNGFLSGPLQLPTGVTLWIDEGVTLFASRNPRDYDKEPNSCGILTDNIEGCHAVITVKNGQNNGIIGDGVIDGRGGQKMIGSNETWWEMSLRAKYAKTDQTCPRLVLVENCQNFTLYRVRLHNSAFYHFYTDEVIGLVVWGVKIDTPSIAYPDQPHARNTDGLDPNGKDMVITQCYIHSGDDNIAIKAKKFRSENVLILDNYFYNGHGMSIGSEINEGAVNVTVRNLYIDNSQNGIRIKSDASKGGHVHGILFDNVCIRNTDIPLAFDTYYLQTNGTKIPKFYDINVTNTRIISSSSKTAIFRGFNKEVPLKITLDNVVSDFNFTNITASNAEITLGPGQVSGIKLEDDESTNVHVKDRSGKSTPIDCSDKFVPFPR